MLMLYMMCSWCTHASVAKIPLYVLSEPLNVMKLWETKLRDVNLDVTTRKEAKESCKFYLNADTSIQPSARLDVRELLEVLALELPLKHTHVCTVNFLACCFTDSCHTILQNPSQQHLQTTSNCLVQHQTPRSAVHRQRGGQGDVNY